jgi:hypothetical protein
MLLFLRLLAGLYAGMTQWWLAMLDGVVTREERRAVVRAVLVPEARAVPVAREAVAEILRG